MSFAAAALIEEEHMKAVKTWPESESASISTDVLVIQSFNKILTSMLKTDSSTG